MTSRRSSTFSLYGGILSFFAFLGFSFFVNVHIFCIKFSWSWAHPCGHFASRGSKKCVYFIGSSSLTLSLEAFFLFYFWLFSGPVCISYGETLFGWSHRTRRWSSLRVGRGSSLPLVGRSLRLRSSLRSRARLPQK
jgi:hypothetical protein